MHDTETNGMFIVTSFIVSVFVIILFVIIKALLKRANRADNIIADALILYLASEFAVFCMCGELCFFFGLFYTLHIYNDSKFPATDIFREKRDFTFSIS